MTIYQLAGHQPTPPAPSWVQMHGLKTVKSAISRHSWISHRRKATGRWSLKFDGWHCQIVIDRR